METNLLKEDFRNFLWYIWKKLGLPDPTPIQYEMAHYLQYGGRRKVIEAYRGAGKSWITSAYTCFGLWRDPDAKFLIVSASKQRADDFSTFTQRLITDIPILQHLEPPDDYRWSKIAFDVAGCRPAHAPSVKSVGVFGQMTGSRATEIIADDTEVQNNSDTEEKREKLLNTIMEFEAIIVPEVGKITYLGTPQTEESIYNKLRSRGYDMRIWTARYPTLEKVGSYQGFLAPSIVEAIEQDASVCGTPTDPLRFNEIELREREASYGRSGFALQFMLDTTLSDAERYPLKTSDLIVMDIDREKAPVAITWSSDPRYHIQELPNVGFTGDKFYRPMFIDDRWNEFAGSLLAIDPSGRGKDETAYVVIKQLHGTLYVSDFGGLAGGYSEDVLSRLADIALEHKVTRVVIEDNFGDGMFTAIFKPILGRKHPATIDEVKHHIQKEKRIIDTLEPVMNRHRLVFDHGAVARDLKNTRDDIKYSLFYQMTHVTRDKGALRHDDRLDCLAMGVAHWQRVMEMDEQKSVRQYEEEALERELLKFMETCTGQPTGGGNWLKIK